jgi:amino acid transporter
METDVEKVRAASHAFYAALNARDASAMAKVWAHTPYVAFISPVGGTLADGFSPSGKPNGNFVTSERAMDARSVPAPTVTVRGECSVEAIPRLCASLPALAEQT